MVNGVIFWYLKLWLGSLCNDLLAVVSSGVQTEKDRPGAAADGAGVRLTAVAQLESV